MCREFSRCKMTQSIFFSNKSLNANSRQQTRQTASTHLGLGLLIGASIQQQLHEGRVTTGSGQHQRRHSDLCASVCQCTDEAPTNVTRTHNRASTHLIKMHRQRCDVQRYAKRHKIKWLIEIKIIHIVILSALTY